MRKMPWVVYGLWRVVIDAIRVRYTSSGDLTGSTYLGLEVQTSLQLARLLFLQHLVHGCSEVMILEAKQCHLACRLFLHTWLQSKAWSWHPSRFSRVAAQNETWKTEQHPLCMHVRGDICLDPLRSLAYRSSRIRVMLQPQEVGPFQDPLEDRPRSVELVCCPNLTSRRARMP